MIRAALLGAMSARAGVAPALAQDEPGLSTSIEAATEERRRGLGWSDGKAVLRGTASLPVANGLSVDATAVTLRGSDRHGGADGVIDLGVSYATYSGGWRLSAEGRYHLFSGASGQGYGEFGAGAGFLLGPASVDLFASYAPRQSTIGGDNLYVAASASAGVPGTPLTLSARIGRSLGSVRDPLRALRLRPDGAYWDHGVSVDYLKGRWLAGLRYSNSSINGPGRRHAGAALIGRVGFTL